MDECAEEADNCHRETNATCTDIVGSFMCSCSEGFTGNGTFCTGRISYFMLLLMLIAMFVVCRC